MKKLTYLLTLFLVLVACNSKGIKETKQSVEDPHLPEDKIISCDSISAKVYGQLILEGKIKPSDNKNTINCLSMLLNQDKFDIEFYFNVYRKIAMCSDGALSEIIGSYAKTFFELNPDFCFEKLDNIKPTEKDLFIENIAFEFYASGLDIESDINEYITSIERNLENKSQSNLDSLKSIKGQLILKTKEINE